MILLARRWLVPLAMLAAPANAQMSAPAELPSAVPPPALLDRAQAAAAASPEQPPWRAPGVALRLSDLGDALPMVRADVLRLRLVQVGEPAEYRLTTLPDYPNTLVIEPIYRPPPGGEPTTRQAMAQMSLPFRTLGNLVLNDYAAPLATATARIGWVRALMALGGTAEAPPTTCLAVSARTAEAVNTGPIQCELAGALRTIDATAQPLPRSFTPPEISLAVRNTARLPRYLYVVVIDGSYVATVLTLDDGRPVAPGAWAERRAGPALRSESVLVTIASATPLSPAVLSERALTLPPDACPGSLAARLCGRSTTSAPVTGWSASIAYLPRQYVPPVGIGGGLPLPSLALAPFMAELYSTVPYTPQEIAADTAKPFADKLFLADRTAAERDHRCGGSLIAPDLVLTAAHCVARDDLAGPRSVLVLARRRIRVGTLMLGSGGRTYAIDALAVHAGYQSGRQLDDIALLHLSADRGSVDDGETPVPIALPTHAQADPPAATPVDALGWGFTHEIAPGARVSLTLSGAVQRNPTWLRDGSMQTLGWDACRERMGETLQGNMLCAVTRTGPRTLIPGLGTFSCVGDSGGPLVRNLGHRPVLVGVTSWSKGCSAAATNASVYTNVARYADWIAAARKSLVHGRAVLVDQRGAASVLPLP